MIYRELIDAYRGGHESIACYFELMKLRQLGYPSTLFLVIDARVALEGGRDIVAELACTALKLTLGRCEW